MAPVHLYLGAWVLGGVLLGAAMLLDAREPEQRARGLEGEGGALAPSALPTGVEPALLSSGSAVARGFLARCLRVLPLGLIGFGLTGLLAKGLDLDVWPWTFLIAASLGVALSALGYRLARARAATSSR